MIQKKDKSDPVTILLTNLQQSLHSLTELHFSGYMHFQMYLQADSYGAICSILGLRDNITEDIGILLNKSLTIEVIHKGKR